MNLSLPESLVLLRQTVGKAFQTESTPARVRAAEASGFDRQLWALFNALGISTGNTSLALQAFALVALPLIYVVFTASVRCTLISLSTHHTLQ